MEIVEEIFEILIPTSDFFRKNTSGLGNGGSRYRFFALVKWKSTFFYRETEQQPPEPGAWGGGEGLSLLVTCNC